MSYSSNSRYAILLRSANGATRGYSESIREQAGESGKCAKKTLTK